MSSSPKVIWLPSHPAQGAISMQRYWAALREAAMVLGRQFDSVLKEPEIPVAKAGKLRRAYEIYWAYPRRCRRMLECGGAEVAHILDHSFAHLLKVVPSRVKTIVTVHDLIPLREPAEMSEAQMGRFRTKMELLRGVDRLVAVSGSTRDDLMEFLGIPEERITVIPNGVATRTDPNLAEGGGAGALLGSECDPFMVLSIGLSVKRKNLGLLPEAFRAYFASGGRGAKLVRVGDGLPQELRSELNDVLGAKAVIECGRLGDPELATLFRRSDALIFPSTYEGFGLPVLEAMAAGCPVAASSIPSHREVGGDCVSYFDPGDAGEAGRVLAEIAAGGRGLEERVSAGREMPAEFTWERHLGCLCQLYGEVAELQLRCP